MKHALALSLALAAVALAPRADACGAPPIRCYGSLFLPADGATIPSNAPALFWLASFGNADGETPTSALSLERVGASAVPFAVEGGSVLRLGEALTEGADYRIGAMDRCGSATVLQRFHAGPSAPFPTSLGATIASAVRQSTEPGSEYGGACARLFPAAIAHVRVELSAEAAPWAAVLRYQTLVDGRPNVRALVQSWPYIADSRLNERLIAGGTDEISLRCTSASAQSVTRRVRFVATIAGRAEAIESNEIEVTLRCDPQSDGGVGDAAAAAPDAAIADATSDSGAPSPHASCCVTRVSASSHSPWITLALVALSLRRAKRRTRSVLLRSRLR